MPARVLLQDFTGVPAVVDLAAMRDAMAEIGGDPARIEPLVPADLVIDHSVQVDRFRGPDAFAFNVESRVRAQRRALPAAALGAERVRRPARRAARHGHRPPGQPRVPRPGGRRARGRDGRDARLPGHARRHRLAHDDGQRPWRPRLRRRRDRGRGRAARPAALPAHATRHRRAPVRRPAARLDRDRPRAGHRQHAPRARRGRLVRRVRRRRPRLAGARRPGDDLEHVARVRRHGGALPDRRRDARPTCARPAAPTSRSRWSRRTPRRTACGASRAPAPTSTRRSSSTLRRIEPTVAGPRRPQDKVRLPDLPANFRDGVSAHRGAPSRPVDAATAVRSVTIDHGSVAIAAITTCTNTSNPTVMIGAGLLARNALARGLTVKPTVKTSLAPGSRAVTEYYQAAGLLEPLEKLGFGVVGYGCTTCIGNSGPLDAEVAARSRRTSSSSRPCCRATATSRAASIRWRARPTSLRRRSSSRSRWPARSRSTC